MTTDDIVSPRAALVFQPTKAQTYYFSYGTSFNPSAEALTLAVNNANTAPEENRSFELGAKWDVIEGRLGLSGALFRIDKTNARVTDIDSGLLVLDGKQQVQGFEIEIVGRILPAWNVFAGYTFLDTEVLDSTDVNNGNRVEGNDLPNAPRNTFSLWTTWDITPMWQVGGGADLPEQALRRRRQRQRGARARRGGRDGRLPARQELRPEAQRAEPRRTRPTSPRSIRPTWCRAPAERSC